MNRQLPKAVLLDLDDTILDDSGSVEDCWSEACFAHASGPAGIDPRALLKAIDKTRDGAGLPDTHSVRPDRIVRRLSDLRHE